MEHDPTSIHDLAPGRVLAGRYRVVGPHRQGGLSSAFELIDEDSGGRCELQVFPTGLFEIPEQAQDFRDRMEPWKEVNSTAVLGVRDVITVESSNSALVTDYPAGVSLRQRLNDRGALTSDNVQRLGVHLLDGLEALHACGLVHGDIKPTTIYLPKDEGGSMEQALLVDGGLTPSLWSAKGLGDQTALIGTPYYAPVEQFGGDSPDVLSDIYNLSAVLYECAAGVLPWRGRSFLEVFQAKLNPEPAAMSERAPGCDAPAALESVIARGCRADRHQRWASAAEFRVALAEVGSVA